MSARTPPSVVSLYSGAGGLDYGFEAAGFGTRVCVDFDHDSCETIRGNREWSVIEANIRDVASQRIMGEAGVTEGEADVLIGGPPCQPFSKSGFWVSGDTRRLDDPRSDTVGEFLRVVEDLAPRVIVFENVRGFAFKGKSEGAVFLEKGIAAINERLGTEYRPSTAILQAADYGVPQLRERFVMVAERYGRHFRFPTASGDLRRNAWDAIGDLPVHASEELSVHGRWADLLPSIPEGNNYLWHTERGGGLPLFGWRRRYWTFLLKLAKDKPSWTIQAQPGPAVGPFHWDNRRLSVRELCRLQTFPDSVEVRGVRQSAQRQIGNAVPSALAEALAIAIRNDLFPELPAVAERSLVPPLRVPVPQPHAADIVPAKFRTLIGMHEPHPGTGRGFAAGAQTPRLPILA